MNIVSILLFFKMLTPFMSGINEELHPLHVSTTDISYNNRSKELEVICTIFTDDLEDALRKDYHRPTDLSRQDMHQAMDGLLKQYILSHLKIKVDGVVCNIKYLGFEIDHESTNIYLESGERTTPHVLSTEVSLLQSLYNDQLNIVHMTVNGKRKSARLDFPQKDLTQSF